MEGGQKNVGQNKQQSFVSVKIRIYGRVDMDLWTHYSVELTVY